MPSNVPATDALLGYLRRNGRQPAGLLPSALGISRPTLTRAFAQAPDVVRIGKARATQYALAREIRGERRWPLYRLDACARVVVLGELVALDRDEFLFVATRPSASLQHPPFEQGVHPDIPWFLEDLRPGGFLGRTFAHRMADELQLPTDLKSWSATHVITALLHGGSAQSGDLVLGEPALERALRDRRQPADLVSEQERPARYPSMARHVMEGEAPGSSPGGEQPKFTATIETAEGRHAAIVKFSVADDSAAARRWTDLLRCEALAGQVLGERGLAAARSRLVEAGGQVFLESRRFDRTDDLLGRLGFISLLPVAAAFFGEASVPWWRLAADLETGGWLDARSANDLRRLYWFGALIANTDMHLGNAGLRLTDTLPLELAPAWDMLPMWLRPGAQGQVTIREYAVPPPAADQVEPWRWAASAALEFWERVETLDALGADVRDFAAVMRGAIEDMAARF